MKKKLSKLTIVLISIIVVLTAILIYGVYTGFQAKSRIENLVHNLDILASQLNVLQGKYDMLKDDLLEIEKSCITNNACKGRFPFVRWNCNNVGDEVSDYSHICVCDNTCNLSITPK